MFAPLYLARYIASVRSLPGWSVPKQFFLTVLTIGHSTRAALLSREIEFAFNKENLETVSNWCNIESGVAEWDTEVVNKIRWLGFVRDNFY